MISDFDDEKHKQIESKIVIIGGGTVGLALASKLDSYGMRTLVLESGGRHISDSVNIGFGDVKFQRSIYKGATEGRFRCIGGTSTRWGGALIPFQFADITAGHWPIDPSEISKFVPDVETFFSLPKGSYEMPIYSKLGEDYIGRIAKWPSFKKRNVFFLVKKRLARSKLSRILLNSTVTDFKVENNKIERILISNNNGDVCEVRGDIFIFCSGAIETTRLLLILNKREMENLGKKRDALGLFFSDHISVQVAKVETKNRDRFNRFFGYQFSKGGGMKNLRFELENNSKLRDNLVPHFFHVSFQEKEENGFTHLRTLLRHLQAGQRIGFKLVVSLLQSIPWLCRAVFWRFVYRRLLFPKRAEIQLHLVVEQVPKSENRIYLDSKFRDEMGTEIPVIDWSTSSEDIEMISNIIPQFLDRWKNSEFSELAEFVPRPLEEIKREVTEGSGIYHPTGSTRMGDSFVNSVVDEDLKVHNLSNTFVLSTSVFPNGGGANPTMMLMLLGYRLASFLRSQF